jgi:non-ribosomal peptide synthetase component E (peptide arylation enzyme)
MAVLESIFAYARSAPRRTALIANGCATSYHDFAASIVLVRRHLRAQAISRDRVAVMVVDNVADAWIIGLALRGLGVTTVNGRSAWVRPRRNPGRTWRPRRRTPARR